MVTLHVATSGTDRGDGTARAPFRRINQAAEIAMPGDTVMVHEGTYREWVDPRRGGLDDLRRITYTAATGERVIIKGSELVSSWQRDSGSVWSTRIPSATFGGFNPFLHEVSGDWLLSHTRDAAAHLGEVYLNGRSLWEAKSLDAVRTAVTRRTVVDDWTRVSVPLHRSDDTQYQWYAEVDTDYTTIWANFHELDPRAETIEINVRRSVFFPTQNHINFITVQGFEMAHAATPWAPPTADQPGLIGPNWAKGWVIQDNLIHDAKCVGVSLGKEASTGDNFATRRGDKSGYQYQIETVFAATNTGWDRDHIGSHIVRRNEIFECGQSAIVGHLGAIFSTLEDNHIHHIATKREFYGHEIAGIKLHAGIDVEVIHNRIHDTTLAMWFDWQSQGLRVSRNLCYRNNRDVFLEVNHGPFLVDHNVFLSPVSLEVLSEGGAFANNLIGGTLWVDSVRDRATPYHMPHSTTIAGFAIIEGGDHRMAGNIFLGGELEQAYGPGAPGYGKASFGTAGLADYPRDFGEYFRRVAGALGEDDGRFAGVLQPVCLSGNLYVGGAECVPGEPNASFISQRMAVSVLEEPEGVYLQFDGLKVERIPRRHVFRAGDFEPVRIASQGFESRHGDPADLSVDLMGIAKQSDSRYPVGPLSALAPTNTKLLVWRTPGMGELG